MIQRRRFLQIAGGAAGALSAGALLAPEDKDAQPAPERKVPSFCELCFWKCGVVATVRGGRVVKIDGHPDHPLSRGRLCPRGNGGTGALYDPDRLKSPLIRTGARGSERFREASWPEALDHVAAKMDAIRKRHGPEAMALFLHGFGGSWFSHLLKAYGSPNIAAPSYAQCRGPREAGFQLTFGTGVGSPENTDIANTRFLVLIGSHLGENMHNTQVQEFADAIRRGAKIVVVDPRFSTAAGKAHWYLPIKPGTDLALLLAWIHVIVREELYDREYVARYATGIDKLKQATAADTPEWAAGITEIPADTIRTVAREMAREKPNVLVHPGRHVTWYGDDTQRSRAIAMLNALLGSWGRAGGFYFPGAPGVPKYPAPAYPAPARPAADGAGTRYPVADETLASGLCDATIAGAPYQAKGWMVYGTNLLQSLPNPKQTVEAIQKLDLLVVIDVLPVEIAGYADVVLPECTYLERHDDLYAGAFREPFLALRQPAVAPMYDSKPGWWIARELGRRLGLAEYFAWKGIEEYLDRRLRGARTSLAHLKESGVITMPAEGLHIAPDHKFDTPSGKVELWSESLASMGVDPVPRYYPQEEPPAGYMRLLFGRSPVHTFGRTTNNRVLASVVRENEVWINPSAAAAFGVRDGERVRLINQDGARSNPVRAKVTKRIRADCVYLVHGFGHKAPKLRAAAGRGASDSDLVTRYKTDPLMGGTGMFVNFVTVAREV
jgi:thiosulfate reductase/polysulfide reductase chain A